MIEKRITINQEITEKGVYYATITASYKDLKISEKMVFSVYQAERAYRLFFEKHPYSRFGLKDNLNTKQVLYISVDPIIHLSDVNANIYEKWKISTENIKNNSIT